MLAQLGLQGFCSLAGFLPFHLPPTFLNGVTLCVFPRQTLNNGCHVLPGFAHAVAHLGLSELLNGIECQ